MSVSNSDLIAQERLPTFSPGYWHTIGLELNDRIRDVVSMRVLIQVDGNLGTEPTYYARFEEAMIGAAREIAANKGSAASSQLEVNFARASRVSMLAIVSIRSRGCG